MGIADLPRPVGYVLGGGGSLGAIQVGMLQALAEHDIAPDLVAGTSVGSLNGAVVARDPKSAASRLSHLWARITREQVFPGGLLAQVRTLQHSKTHLFPSTGLAAVIADFLGAGTTFADLALPFAAIAMDVATARPHVLREGPLVPALLASAAMPGIFAPVRLGTFRLYDGGLVANVPMQQAVAMGARSLVVRSMGLAKSFGAGLTAMRQGEVPQYTSLLEDSRRHAIDRMIDNARLLGANAVIAMRFDSSEVSQQLTEVVAYGTAVVVRPRE